jgi:NitT/TauT family transport system substrate-binding protein
MRRSAIVAAAAAVTLAPTIARAQALKPVHVASAPNDDLIAVLWAIEGGGFRRAGLDVTLQKANSGAAVAAAVAGAAIDIGKSSLLNLLTARAKGVPFVLVAPSGIAIAESPTAGMVVAKDSPIRTGRDLNGKIVGVAGLNDLLALGSSAWIDQNGGDAKTLRFVEITASAVAESVAAGRIDAGTMPNPQMGLAVEGGRVRLLCYPTTAIARRFLQASFFSTADYLAKNRDTVAAYRHAIIEASAYANEHHEQMIPILSRFTGVDAKVIGALPQQMLGTSLDVRLIQPLLDVALKYGAVTSRLDARAMIDPAAL